jgi:hypothetical protein
VKCYDNWSFDVSTYKISIQAPSTTTEALSQLDKNRTSREKDSETLTWLHLALEIEDEQ